MIRLERSAASREASKRVNDGGDGWREREGVGEMGSKQIRAKTERWRYLRSWGSTAELQEMSATAIELGNGGFAGSSGELKRGGEKGEGGRPARGFIGQARCGRWNGERGAR